MTESKQPHGDEPKKKSLKLLLRSKPVAEVETSIGRIYLYPLRVRDMTDFEKLEPAEAIDQIRNFLTSIGSLLAAAVPLRVGNAAIQPLEPSARNPLISKGAGQAPCGLLAFRGERGRREEWHVESERWPRTGQMANRRSPQVSARTRANTRGL
jgi:hypothetical protein